MRARHIAGVRTANRAPSSYAPPPETVSAVEVREDKWPGTLTAIDAGSGKTVWQKTWKKSCYSGTVSTGGNVLFVGRNSGLLQDYDAMNGKLLWSFDTIPESSVGVWVKSESSS